MNPALLYRAEPQHHSSNSEMRVVGGFSSWHWLSPSCPWTRSKTSSSLCSSSSQAAGSRAHATVCSPLRHCPDHPNPASRLPEASLPPITTVTSVETPVFVMNTTRLWLAGVSGQPLESASHEPSSSSYRRRLQSSPSPPAMDIRAVLGRTQSLVCDRKCLQPSATETPEVTSFPWSWKEHFW